MNHQSFGFLSNTAAPHLLSQRYFAGMKSWAIEDELSFIQR
jgi:hypothetical protein